MSIPFFEKLERRVVSHKTLLCVGLDPHSADLKIEGNTAEGALIFCKRLIEATHEYAAAFKPNAAFFEAFGMKGIAALEEVIKMIPEGIPIVLDVKRGDISTTAEAYATSAYRAYGVDCVTVNAYMGADSVTPFASDPTKGVFVLCKTSNPSSNELQTVQVLGTNGSGGGNGKERLFEVVARLATTKWNANKNIGLVVGATDAAALRATRDAVISSGCPETWILAPGIGFQGGDLKAALVAGLSPAGSGMLCPVSRGISRADNPSIAAQEIRDAINTAIREIVAERSSAAETTATATTTSSSDTAVASKSSVASAADEFIRAAIAANVLTFGKFTLKSGRISPYFFNAGLFRSGASIAALGRTYARTIRESGIEFDVLFGPAYKGIPLVTTAAVALSDLGIDVPFCYNRKEAKEHGEGGTMVGADVKGLRVLIVDDVISAGTAIGEAVEIIKAAGGIPVGVVIGLDRQERGSGDSTQSAVQTVQATYGIPVRAVAALENLVAFIEQKAKEGADVSSLVGKGGENLTISGLLEAVNSYKNEYGVVESK
jgi:uridine monophosphate synthetase